MPAAAASGAHGAEPVAVRLFSLEEALAAGFPPAGGPCPEAILEASRDLAGDTFALALLPLDGDGGADALVRIAGTFVPLREIARGPATADGGPRVRLFEDETGLVRVTLDLRAPPEAARGPFPAAEGALHVAAGALVPALLPVRMAPACAAGR